MSSGKDPETSPEWTPLAGDGRLRERAWQAVHHVAAELATLLPPAVLGIPGLGAGDAGLALFFHALHAATRTEDAGASARVLLDRAIGAMELPGTSLGLYRGAPGVGWTLAHLRAHGAADHGDEVLAAVDQAVLAALRAESPPASFDLVGGLVGLGVYALERLPAPGAVEALEAVVDRLERAAQRSGEGAAWLTPPDALQPWQRARLPGGVYDVGMAHGAAGVIALLARVVDAGVAAGRARDLLDGAVRWLRAHEMPAGAPSRYPARVAPGQAPAAARLAWCYGDPGVGVALLAAARALGDAELDAHARGVLVAATRRDPDASGVADAPFCHGAAGLAHLFHRAWRATGEPALGDAALRFLELTLDLPVPEGVRSRFPFRAPGDGGAAWLDRPGVLEGAAGVGLVLLAAVSSVPPAWDRIFLADVGAPPSVRA